MTKWSSWSTGLAHCALHDPLEEHTAFFPFLVQLAEEAEQDKIHVAQVVGEALKVHEA